MTAPNLLSTNDKGIEPAVEAGTVVDKLDKDLSIQMYQDAIDKEPFNYWLWHNLCRLYAVNHDLDGAIQACLLGIEKSTTNPSPRMELSSLYAAKGDYRNAVMIYTKSRIKPAMLRLALKASRNPCNSPSSHEIQLRQSLER